LTGDEFDAMALTGQHFNFHRLLLGQHIGSSKPPVLPRGVNSRLALGGHFYSGGDNWGTLPLTRKCAIAAVVMWCMT
ncbi:hypothetical protein, partial [Pseudomonas syringae]|uniref:hypothetical protein n=1 Tax=Pseudomonas syringae TaxID=317 RepID=UPI001CA5F1A9